MALSAAIGSMVYAVKEFANKREVPTDINRLIQEGVVRADVWGSVGEMDGFVSATTGGQMGFRDFLGPDTHYAYHGQGGYLDGLAQTLLGPTYSSGMEGARALGGLSHLSMDDLGTASASQIRAWRRLMPYQNLFYTDFLFDSLENGVQSAGKRQARARAIMDSIER